MAKNHKVSYEIRTVFLCFSVLLVNVILAADDYIPTDRIFLDCGSSDSPFGDNDGREWKSDNDSKFLTPNTGSSSARADTQAPDEVRFPCTTARISKSQFTYSIPVTPGRHFIRLYFYPSVYSGLNTNNAIFSVKAGPYTLLSNFSAALTAEALGVQYLRKEYAVNVRSETLNISFKASSKYPNSFVFVNGIEVLSMPCNLYDTPIDSPERSPIIVDGGNGLAINNSTALELLYRVNVGVNDIRPSDDNRLLRFWSNDTGYIFGAALGATNTAPLNESIKYPKSIPRYIAPSQVYSTSRAMLMESSQVNLNFNLTWIFPVDTGFTYFVRLHFCDIYPEMSKINHLVFNIYLKNQTATSGFDVIQWAKSNWVPYYRDYIVTIPPEKEPQQNLWLALHPNISTKPKYTNALLNGVEILKLNNSNGSLAGKNPIPQQKDTRSSSHKSSHRAAIGGGGVAGGIVLVLVAGLLVYFISHHSKYGKVFNCSDGQSGKMKTTGSSVSSLPLDLCHCFSFAEIKAATNNFDESLLLGVGGFGKVYKGEIDEGKVKVAIKRGNPLSRQGMHEFQTEIEMLSKLRHRHLVSLLGYCEEEGEMILVYDYMANGTLSEHLYGAQRPPLSWNKRLEICLGAACGLHYLHSGAKQTIIHRDVKTTNILLDDKWVAKVSDFGVAKTGLDQTHISTVVKGSFGYLDPEYFRRQQLTTKSDVYSFGVVLLEILCARPALKPSLPEGQVNLAEWAVHCYKKGKLEQIMDPYLEGKINPECFNMFVETAMKCVSEQGINRPSMGDVLWNLESALQLQKSAETSSTGLEGMDLDEGEYDIECGKEDLGTSQSFDGNAAGSRTALRIGDLHVASI